MAPERTTGRWSRDSASRIVPRGEPSGVDHLESEEE
jgi:hypothetical protein